MSSSCLCGGYDDQFPPGVRTSTAIKQSASKDSGPQKSSIWRLADPAPRRPTGRASRVLTRACACCEPGITSGRGRSVGGGEDDVGGLDDCRDLLALLEAEFAGCLHGDGGDQTLAVDVDLDIGDRGALFDALDGAGELVAGAELHDGCSCRWSGTIS